MTEERRSTYGSQIALGLALLVAASSVTGVGKKPPLGKTANSRATAGKSGKRFTDEDWKRVSRKWQPFAAEHMMRMIEHELKQKLEWLEADKSGERKFYLGRYGDLSFKWVRLEHPLVSTYFPEYRLLVQRPNRFIFAIHKNGTITLLDSSLPLNKAYKTTPNLRLRTFSELLAGNSVSVDTAARAADMVNLWRVVRGRGGGIQQL